MQYHGKLVICRGIYMEIIKQIKDVVSKFYYIFTPKQRKGILMPDNLLQDAGVAWRWNLLHVSSARQLVLWVSAGTILVYVLKNLYMSF